METTKSTLVCFTCTHVSLTSTHVNLSCTQTNIDQVHILGELIDELSGPYMHFRKDRGTL